MNFTIYNSLILAGIIQGFLFSFIVFSSAKHKSKSNFFLAGLILSFSFNNLQFYLSDAGIISGSQLYRFFYIPFGSLSPVLFLLFVISFLQPNFKFERKHYLLFLPFSVFLVGTTFYKIHNLFFDINTQTYQWYKTIQGIQSAFSWLFSLILIGISYLLTNKYSKKNRSIGKQKIKVDVWWIQITLLLLFLFTLLWGIALAIYLKDANSCNDKLFTFVWIALSIIIYWFGHIGFYKNGILQERGHIRKNISKRKTENAKQQRTRTTNPIAMAFEKLMIHEKKFLDSSVSLESISAELGVSKSHLSRTINNQLNTSFNDYVNKLRIEEAKSLLANPEFQNYTILSIALEAGFNSKSTFNAAFEKHLGVTPSV